MSETFDELRIKLEFMQNNISEINLYLEEAKQSKTHKIPQNVYDLHRETTKCGKEVSEQLKQLAHGSDLHQMRIHRTLLVDFLSILSDLSALQRLIIDRSVNNHDCIDCGKRMEVQTSNTLISQLIASNRTYFWLFIGIAVMGGFTLFRSFIQ